MPSHLSSLTRRQFLKQTFIASAGLALAPHLPADEKAADPNTWALLSDIHIPADRTRILRNANTADHLSQAIREILALPQRPAGALVTGDCAALKGEVADYTTLSELMQPMRDAKLPFHLINGNHDGRENINAAFPDTTLSSGNRRAGLVSTPLVNWFLLDSLEKTNSTPGELGEEQRAWLAKTLDANPDKPAIVAAHHYFETGKKAKPTGLLDAKELLAILAPRKQVKAYFFGHSHVWDVSKHESGIHLVNLPALGYVFAPTQTTAWVLATFSAQGAALKFNALDHAHASHGQTVELKWRTT